MKRIYIYITIYTISFLYPILISIYEKFLILCTRVAQKIYYFHFLPGLRVGAFYWAEPLFLSVAQNL
jgi:hypothetical protein